MRRIETPEREGCVALSDRFKRRYATPSTIRALARVGLSHTPTFTSSLREESR